VAEPVHDLSRRILDHAAAIEDLLEAIRAGRDPLCGPEPARETIEMTQAVFASWVAGGRVTLPLAQRTSPLHG
jgi:hypothetical protein